MSFVIKDERVESLDNITIENEGVGLTIESNDLDLNVITKIRSEIQHQDEEINTIESEDMQEVLVQTQNIDAEMAKVGVTDVKQKNVVPPLRPLTIAPKPAKMQLPFKTIPGQQLLLVQSTTPGQPIKLLSPGQGINLSNLQLGKAVSLKTAPAKSPQNAISLVQSKQLVMKKLVTQVPKTAVAAKSFESKTGPQIVVVQKSEPQMKILQTSGGTTTIASTPTKTLTLSQAQQMGIISGTKIIPQVTTGSKQIILNKNQSKAIKIVPQLKSPTKILPAPQNQGGKVAQRIIIKPAGGTATGTVLPNQIVVAGNQTINTGQVHQINIPGKGMQYIKFITTSQSEAGTSNVVATSKSSTIATKVIPVSTAAGIKTGNVILSEIKTISKPVVNNSKVTKLNNTGTSVRPLGVNLANNNATGQLVVVPTAYVSRNVKIPIPAIRHSTSNVKTSTPNTGDAVVPNPPASTQSPEISLESNGMRPRKPCNCTKSQCLKLYCDCFANGEFCYMCNCMNCFNNLENEEHRQRAIKNCLERNPNAFRPKIGKAKDHGDAAIRKHTKGCNCKRSGCLKNYCECYEAKIACSSNCKCMGCRNIEDSMDKKNNRNSILSDSSFSLSPQINRKNSFIDTNFNIRTKKISNNKQAFNYITNAVIEATSQCLLTLSKNAEESEQDDELTKKQIVEEFGRCLKQIIDCSISKNQMKVN